MNSFKFHTDLILKKTLRKTNNYWSSKPVFKILPSEKKSAFDFPFSQWNIPMEHWYLYDLVLSRLTLFRRGLFFIAIREEERYRLLFFTMKYTHGALVFIWFSFVSVIVIQEGAFRGCSWTREVQHDYLIKVEIIIRECSCKREIYVLYLKTWFCFVIEPLSSKCTKYSSIKASIFCRRIQKITLLYNLD